MLGAASCDPAGCWVLGDHRLSGWPGARGRRPVASILVCDMGSTPKAPPGHVPARRRLKTNRVWSHVAAPLPPYKAPGAAGTWVLLAPPARPLSPCPERLPGGAGSARTTVAAWQPHARHGSGAWGVQAGSVPAALTVPGAGARPATLCGLLHAPAGALGAAPLLHGVFLGPAQAPCCAVLHPSRGGPWLEDQLPSAPLLGADGFRRLSVQVAGPHLGAAMGPRCCS